MPTQQRINKIENVLNKRQSNITIVLENVFDPHNIAAVMRTCDSIGIMEIFILNTTLTTPKKFSTKASSSANKWLHIHTYTNTEQCVIDIKKNYDFLFCSYLNPQAKNMYDIDMTKKIALVFGNETMGVSDTLKNKCDGLFYIPQVGMIQSLNISVACAVTLYEAFRQKTLANHYDNINLSKEKYNFYLTQWQNRDIFKKNIDL